MEIGLVEQRILLVKTCHRSDGEVGGQVRTDGHLVVPSVLSCLLANGRFAPKLEVVKRIAVEDVALLAASELEAAVEVDEAAQETELHAEVAGEVARVRQAHLEHAADACVHEVDASLPETEVQTQTHLCIEVSVELSFAVPSLPSCCAGNAYTVYLVADVRDADVEASLCAHVGIENAEVYIDVAPYACSEHYATRGVGAEFPDGFLAGTLSLAYVSRLNAVAAAAAGEELTDVLRDRRQSAVVWQLVAHTEVGIRSDLHFHNLRLKVDEYELAAFALLRFAQIEVPLHLVEVHTFVAPCKSKVERYLGS